MEVHEVPESNMSGVTTAKRGSFTLTNHGLSSAPSARATNGFQPTVELRAPLGRLDFINFNNNG